MRGRGDTGTRGLRFSPRPPLSASPRLHSVSLEQGVSKMALTAAQITQVYEIFGVPQNGVGQIVGAIATPFGPGFDSCDTSALVTAIDARLAALTTSQLARVNSLLTRWDAITSSSPLRVEGSSGARGTVADHPAERALIRTALSNLIGVAVPAGGFAAEAGIANRATVGR